MMSGATGKRDVPASLLVLLTLWCCAPRFGGGSHQSTIIEPGFKAVPMDYVDNDGFFLISNSSQFAFGFITASAAAAVSYVLSLVHVPSSTVVWTANPAHLINPSDIFAFSADGDVSLSSSGSTIWSTNTSAAGATSMRLLDSGNLVVLGKDVAARPIWQSFSFPTDTLLSNQTFADDLALVSLPNTQNLTFRLVSRSGDIQLQADFQPPQPYWSILKEKRKVVNKIGSGVHRAVLASNSWDFYDNSGTLLWQLILSDFSSQAGVNTSTLAAILGSDGILSFKILQGSGATSPSATKVPQDSCDTPEPCDPYYICSSGPRCQCPSVLGPNCNPGIAPSPCKSKAALKVVKIDDGIGYFGTNFLTPISATNLTGCRGLCEGNCSCLAAFHNASSGDCFLFDQIGSLQASPGNTTGCSTLIKVANSGGDSGSGAQQGGNGGGGNHLTMILIICVGSAAVIAGLIFTAARIYSRNVPETLPAEEALSDDDESFFENMVGMPIRFSYRELYAATDNFAVKLGGGGFGSVYLGQLPDGSRIAVKKLEGIGQGKKEFRSEVTIIGSIHHIHLVKLRGFCAEGAHRLLAYEYMAKGSLDRWIFRSVAGDVLLDWDNRFNIALETAKGLAYLHQECENKIIHCDIKPENVLLDENFHAKVSDFGLAKLMTREQSQAFTTMRGTRGYLAPEWITNYAISEKSDVYSYGMVLLEIVGGRKNFDPAESSEKAHFPSFAFKKLEEGKLKDVFDTKLKYDEKDRRVEIAIKVALWCIQEEFSLRPSMSKVVQMLEGLCDVPEPPPSGHIGSRLYANAFKSISEEGTSSGWSECTSETLLSAVRLSGPR